MKTANREPPHVKFYFHNEYGRSAHFPGTLFFNSLKVPDEGESSDHQRLERLPLTRLIF